jgi:hypothetical protein
MSADFKRHRPHHDTSHISSTYPVPVAYLYEWNGKEHEVNRSYTGGQSLYGCPVEGVTEWIHLVGNGAKPWNVGKFRVGWAWILRSSSQKGLLPMPY